MIYKLVLELDNWFYSEPHQFFKLRIETFKTHPKANLIHSKEESRGSIVDVFGGDYSGYRQMAKIAVSTFFLN